jgi:hypothetical protein
MRWPEAAGGAAAGAPSSQHQQLQAVCRLELGEQQPRSLAGLNVDGRSVLLAGTSQGQVLSWELQPGAAPDAPLLATAPRSVGIGSTSVSLQVAMGSTTTTSSSYVYAHSDADAIFRPKPYAAAAASPVQPHAPLPLPATELIEACRIVGGERLRAACPLHARSMPDSLAWVSYAGRLCFGALDPELKLRWTAAPVGDTPLHTAWHAPSGCAAVVTEARGAAARRGGRQVLRLLEGRGLRQVAALALAEGHACTACEVLDLPCSGADGGGAAAAAPAAAGASALPAAAAEGAAAAKQKEQGRPPGTRPFLVVASAVESAAARMQPACAGPPSCGAPARGAVGLLSVFDIRALPAAASGMSGGDVGLPAGSGGDSGSTVRYEIVLLGAVPLNSTPVSLCMVTAIPLADLGLPALEQHQQKQPRRQERQQGQQEQQQQAQQPGGDRPRDEPLLMVGGESGVAAYRVWVDDHGAVAQAAVERELAQTMELDEAVAPQQQQQAPSQPAASGPAITAAAASAPNPARHRVFCRRAAACSALARTPAVALRALPGAPGCFVALEALGSVTVIQAALAPRSRRALLLPVSADRSGAMCMAACEVPGSRAVVVATHPGGLMHLQRDRMQEHAMLSKQALQAVMEFEAGGQARRAAGAEGAGQEEDEEGWEGGGGGGGGGLGVPPAWVGGGEVAGDGGVENDAARWWEDEGERRRWRQWRQQQQQAAGGGDAAAAGQAARPAVARSPADLLECDALDGAPMQGTASTAQPPAGSLLCPLRLGLVSRPLDQEVTDQEKEEDAGAKNVTIRSVVHDPIASSAPILCITSAGAVSAVQLRNLDDRVLWPHRCSGLQQAAWGRLDSADPTCSDAVDLTCGGGGDGREGAASRAWLGWRLTLPAGAGRPSNAFRAAMATAGPSLNIGGAAAAAAGLDGGGEEGDGIDVDEGPEPPTCMAVDLDMVTGEAAVRLREPAAAVSGEVAASAQLLVVHLGELASSML